MFSDLRYDMEPIRMIREPATCIKCHTKTNTYRTNYESTSNEPHLRFHSTPDGQPCFMKFNHPDEIDAAIWRYENHQRWLIIKAEHKQAEEARDRRLNPQPRLFD